ncbi:MAG: hypothetical protein HC890_03175 [Chloroflexaceae bacterium]|nr:hypothetical protein [Chloroflexaceae bacterium]
MKLRSSQLKLRSPQLKRELWQLKLRSPQLKRELRQLKRELWQLKRDLPPLTPGRQTQNAVSGGWLHGERSPPALRGKTHVS